MSSNQQPFMNENEASTPTVSSAVLDCCADWQPQTELVNGPIIMQTLRSGGAYQYPGIPFRYCPWCGKKRPEQEKQSNAEVRHGGTAASDLK